METEKTTAEDKRNTDSYRFGQIFAYLKILSEDFMLKEKEDLFAKAKIKYQGWEDTRPLDLIKWVLEQIGLRGGIDKSIPKAVEIEREMYATMAKLNVPPNPIDPISNYAYSVTFTEYNKEKARCNLIAYRKAQGLTQKKIASNAGMDIRQLQRFESGERSLIGASYMTVHNLASALNKNMDLLIFGTIGFKHAINLETEE